MDNGTGVDLATESTLDRYRRRADRVLATMDAAEPVDWSRPSPCTDWDARGVVGHLVTMHEAMVTPIGRSFAGRPTVADDPRTAFLAAREVIEALLSEPEYATRQISTPGGPMTVEQHVDQVASADLVVHGWDLARALGVDDTMDPAEVAAAYPVAQHIPEVMRIPEAFGPGIVVFGPIVDVPADAPVQDRLLGLMGRDPYWQPPA